jgi:uncharacterized protein (TIGR00269 family)
MKCKRCKDLAVVALPSHHAGFCRSCFLGFFSRQVEKAIVKKKLFTREDRILVAVSGGKDSLALMLELAEQDYNVTGLHVDLSIPNSSEAARQVVESFCNRHGLPLQVKTLGDEGLAIPLVKKTLSRPVCSACGKLKRYFFNKAALDGNFNVLATGHNLDDEIARLFSNVLRWDMGYLSDQGPHLPACNGFARKVKPLFRLSEFETANYAFLKGIDYHTAPCPYSAGASFTFHKTLWEDLEYKMPGRKLDFYLGFLKRGQPVFAAKEAECGEVVAPCERCTYPTSGGICGVCRIRSMVAEKTGELRMSERF